MANRGAYTQPAEQDSFINGQPASGNPYTYEKPRSGKRNKWLWIGLPILLIVVILAAVLGGVLGSRASNDDSNNSSNSASDNGSNNGGTGTSTVTATDTQPWISGAASNIPNSISESTIKLASAAAKLGGNDDLLFAGTDIYSNPYFKPAASKASSPTLQGNSVGNCAADPWTATNSVTDLRPHPRIMAAEYQWDCLPSKIANDAYLTAWNASIFNNATKWASQDPVEYVMDGGSGILDPARDVQQRLKAWAYAWRLSKDQKWVDRAFQEMQYVSGNASGSSWAIGNGQNWNPGHFLDTAELTAAFGIAYDWMYDGLTDQQRTDIMYTILEQGLDQGATQYANNAWFFQPVSGNGNWNCVTNGGLMTGALAIQSEDPTGTANSIIGNSVGNFGANCMRGVYEDGTWSETPNYWYFGTNAHARAVSALTTSTGSDQGLMAMNQDFTKTGLFHMYVSGNGGMFAYGDNGPNKFAISANQLFYYANLEGNPLYSLFQRDRADAADPLSMIWYQPETKGAFWDGLPLDNFFSAENGSWVSMRSSWTDFTGTYVAMKSSILTDHQTHGDLDVGDFVLDAMGTRWAGEFGNANYLSTDYFSSEAQDALRYEYYRKGTQGQNTLIIGNQNQRVTAQPQNKFETTNATQSVDIAYKPGTNDVAYFTTDMSSAYDAANGAVQRGIRMLNGRRQVLVQDEIAASVTDSIVWQINTNATITLSDDKRTATMKIKDLKGINAGYQVDGSLNQEQTMIAKILEPSGATFEVTTPPQRLYGNDPNTASGEQGDQANPGISTLSINLSGGSDQTIAVVWQPQWADLSDADKADPKSVPLAQWSLISHNA